MIGRENQKTILTFGVDVCCGALIGKSFKKPPIFVGLFTGIGRLLSDKIVNVMAKLSPSGNRSNVKLYESFLDMAFPYCCHKITDNFVFFEKHNIDFCLRGSFMVFFITRKIREIIKNIVHFNDESKAKIESQPFILKDLKYIISSAAIGYLFGGKKSKSREIHMLTMGLFALVEKSSLRLVSTKTTNKHIKKMVVNTVHLLITVTTFISVFFQIKAVNDIAMNVIQNPEAIDRGVIIDDYKCIKAHLLNTIFWNSLKSN